MDIEKRICRVIRGPRVLQHLLSFLSPVDAGDIKRAYECLSTERATCLLLDTLLKRRQSGKWQAFIEALEESDYPYLVSLLKSTEASVEDYRHQKRIIQIFVPYLGTVLEPNVLLGHLSAANLIDAMDAEEIAALERSDGPTAATIFMLDRIQCRQSPSKWYTEFLRILYINGYKHLVREMEPDFTVDCELLKSPNDFIGDFEAAEDISEESLTEHIIETRLDGFRQEIIELVSVSKIIGSLSCYLLPLGTSFAKHLLFLWTCVQSFIVSETSLKLSQLSKTCNKEAMESLLEEVSKINCHNKWSLLVKCLKESDYSYIAGILTRTCERSSHYRERNLVKIFTPSLQYQLDPRELIGHLLADNVINELDKEEILRKYRSSGSIAASIALLDCMQCRLHPEEWYSAFLFALIKCGRQDLVEMVDPDFQRKSSCCDVDFNKNYEDDALNIENASFRLVSAYGKVLQMEHLARQEVAKLRKMYDKMESDALKEILDVTAELTNGLLETEDKIQKLSQIDEEGQMKAERLVEKVVAKVKNKTFQFVPSRDFLSCLKLGTIKRRKYRQGQLNSHRSPSPCIAYRDRSLQRQRSWSPSVSSHSSGYLHIDNENNRLLGLSAVCSTDAEYGIENNTFKRKASETSTFSGSASSLSASSEMVSLLTDSNSEVSLFTDDLNILKPGFSEPIGILIHSHTIALSEYQF